MIQASNKKLVDAAITSRRSIRAFLRHPVAREDIEAHPGGGGARAVRHQYPAVESVRADRRRARAPVRRDPGRARRPRRGPRAYRRIRLLPARMGLALHRPAPQGRLGSVRAAWPDARQQGRHGGPARAQLPLLRRAGGPDLHHRPRPGAGLLARLRHVPAEHHGGGARTRPRHLSAGGLHPVSTASSPSSWACRPTRWWCAAWRWAMPIPSKIENSLVTEREPVAGFVRFLE